jgi:tetratricopeptide (TPR) repeat protein
MADSEAFQAAYDDATFAYTQGDYAAAESAFRGLLATHPEHFDARLSLAMCLYRQGNYPGAIEEGHRAERLKPNEQLVHTNLSLFYMKSGDKTTAEKHGLQARIAGWKEGLAKPATGGPTPAAEVDPELQLAQPKPKAFKLPEKFPEMPWKKTAKPPTPPPASPGTSMEP